MSKSEPSPLNTTIYYVLFKTKHREVSGPNLPEKYILELEFKKIIVEFRINTFENHYLWNIVQNKVLLSFGTKICPKRVFLGPKLRKGLWNLESAPYSPSFIKNKTLLSFRAKFGQRRCFGDGICKKTIVKFRISNPENPCIPSFI